MSTIPEWVRVGAEVECIADPALIAAAKAKRPWGRFPENGGAYRVRGVVVGTNGVANLLLEGIVNPPRRSTVGKVEWGFQWFYFRPITKRTAEQDIAEHFADLLKVGAPERVGETA